MSATRRGPEGHGEPAAPKESGREYRSLLETLQEGIWAVDLEGVTTFANPALARLLGYTVEEMLGRHLFDFMEVRREVVAERLLDLRISGTRGHHAEELIRRDGNRVSCLVSTTPILDEAGAVVGGLASVLDITALKQAEEALRDSEEHFRSLVESSLDAVLLMAFDGSILAANPAAGRMFGYSEEELRRVGRGAVVDESDPRLREALEERERSGAFHGALTLIRRDGTRFPGEISWAAFRVKGGQLRSAMVIRDTTERMIARDELRESWARYRALAAHLQDVREEERASVARELHDELGQVLTALKMDIRWLGKRVDSDRTELRDKINGMVELVNRTIQSVQRIASSLRPGLLDDLGLEAAIEWLGADFQRHAGIPCDVSVELTESRIGPKGTTALFRLIQEASTNVARHANAAHVSISVRETSGNVEASVTDDGIGIAPEDASGAHSLGLIGMRERAEGIGGTLTIQGKRGEGTRVSVVVPFPLEGGIP